MMKILKKWLLNYTTIKSQQVKKVREYGISNSVLYKWIKEYSPIKAEDGTVTNNKEIQKLKKELSKIREENEILKKAIAIFTQK